MSRKLISVDKILEDLGEEPYIWTDTDAEIQEHSDWLRFKAMIEAQPTVDAVEVVRCKDCKYRKYRVCAMPYAGMWVGVELKDSDFCSYGERKDKE